MVDELADGLRPVRRDGDAYLLRARTTERVVRSGIRGGLCAAPGVRLRARRVVVRRGRSDLGCRRRAALPAGRRCPAKSGPTALAWRRRFIGCDRSSSTGANSTSRARIPVHDRARRSARRQGSRPGFPCADATTTSRSTTWRLTIAPSSRLPSRTGWRCPQTKRRGLEWFCGTYRSLPLKAGTHHPRMSG